jgi:hypothetical protein
MIIEFGFDAFPFLIAIVPIVVLFLSFLVCDYVIDFEARKVNINWILLIALAVFAFIFRFNFGPGITDPDQNAPKFLDFVPLVLFLIYFIFLETVINYMDYKIYLRMFKKPKAVSKGKTGKITKHSTPKQTQSPITPEEQFGWAVFFSLLLFYILVFLMGNMIMFSAARVVGFAILVGIPILLVILYIKYHSASESIFKSNSKSEPGSGENGRGQTEGAIVKNSLESITEKESAISKNDERLVNTTKYLDLILHLGLIIFGFLVIIIYSTSYEIEPIFMQGFSILIWILIFYGFYNLGLPRGGADTKALMALVILFPIYPILNNFTQNTAFLDLLVESPELGLEYFLPVTFTMLMNSVFIMLFYILGLVVYNGIKGNLAFPHAFLGYKMALKDIPSKFVWPMEQLVDDKRVLKVFPGTESDLKLQLKKFHKRGIKSIWVTSKIPFMIPLTIGLILTILAGNLIFELIMWF